MEEKYFKIQLEQYNEGRCYVGFSGPKVMRVIPRNGAYFTEETIKHPMIQRFLQYYTYRKVDYTDYDNIKYHRFIFDYPFSFDPSK